MRKAVLLLLALVVIGLVWRQLAGAPSASDEAYFGRTTPPDENVFTFTNGTEPELLDPGLMSGQPDGRIARCLFEGLLVPHPETLEPIAGMATHYEREDQGRRYVFHLRHDAVWSNGEAVTARDFEYSWLRVLHPDIPARYADLLYIIENAKAYKSKEISDVKKVGIRALDDFTLEVRLVSPTPYFVQLVTFYTFLPVHEATVEKHGDRWTHPQNIVSNGPFTLESHRQNDSIIMKKFPRYWDAANVYMDRIVAYSNDDLSTMLNMYRAGMTDWNPSGYLPAEFIPYVMHYQDFSTGPYLGLYFYSIVVTQKPFDDVRVRRALALAIDRERICTHILHNSRTPWGGVVPQGFRDYPYPQHVSFDPEKARQLLAEAGFPNGEGFPKSEILFNTSEDHKKIAEAIQAMWKDYLGIEVSLLNQEWATYLRNTIDKNYEIARRSWIGDYDDPNTFLAILRSTDGNNRTGWVNPEYDRLIDAAGRELDPNRRLQLLSQAEAIALEELPFLPIYSYRSTEFIAPYVRGLYPTSLDTHPLKFVSFDRSGAGGPTP